MPPEYERWAASTRAQIAQQSRKRNEIMASNLNESTKAALVLVLDKFDTSFKSMGDDFRKQMIEMEKRLDQKLQSQITTLSPIATAAATLPDGDSRMNSPHRHLPQEQRLPYASAHPQHQETRQQQRQPNNSNPNHLNPNHSNPNHSNALLALRKSTITCISTNFC